MSDQRAESQVLEPVANQRNNIVEPQTKLTDLNVDCLEKICRCLELCDLLKDLSKNLKNAAILVFNFKYKLKPVTIEKIRRSSCQLLTVNDIGIKIVDSRTCFQFLRGFGY